jgi:hypothetical protein
MWPAWGAPAVTAQSGRGEGATPVACSGDLHARMRICLDGLKRVRVHVRASSVQEGQVPVDESGSLLGSFLHLGGALGTLAAAGASELLAHSFDGLHPSTNTTSTTIDGRRGGYRSSSKGMHAPPKSMSPEEDPPDPSALDDVVDDAALAPPASSPNVARVRPVRRGWADQPKDDVSAVSGQRPHQLDQGQRPQGAVPAAVAAPIRSGCRARAEEGPAGGHSAKGSAASKAPAIARAAGFPLKKKGAANGIAHEGAALVSALPVVLTSAGAGPVAPLEASVL